MNQAHRPPVPRREAQAAERWIDVDLGSQALVAFEGEKATYATIVYFEKRFALHGAFWHSSFGRERSHGYVNLTPHDARHIFKWAGPAIPEGWHGVKAMKENPGTRVIVHK